MISKIRNAVHRQLADSAWQAVAGLGFLSGAAFTLNLTAGLAAVGVSFLLLEWRADR